MTKLSVFVFAFYSTLEILCEMFMLCTRAVLAARYWRDIGARAGELQTLGGQIKTKTYVVSMYAHSQTMR